MRPITITSCFWLPTPYQSHKSHHLYFFGFMLSSLKNQLIFAWRICVYTVIKTQRFNRAGRHASVRKRMIRNNFHVLIDNWAFNDLNFLFITRTTHARSIGKGGQNNKPYLSNWLARNNHESKSNYKVLAGQNIWYFNTCNWWIKEYPGGIYL